MQHFNMSKFGLQQLLLMTTGIKKERENPLFSIPQVLKTLFLQKQQQWHQEQTCCRDKTQGRTTISTRCDR